MDKIEYQNDYAFYDANNQPIYHSCENIDIYHPGERWERRCGGVSMYIIFYIGQLTGNKISKHLCDRCFTELITKIGRESMINLNEDIK